MQLSNLMLVLTLASASLFVKNIIKNIPNEECYENLNGS